MQAGLILAQSVIDEGFFDQCDAGCYLGFAGAAAVLVGLGFVLSRTRRRAEEAYWQRRRREAELRAADPDMASNDDMASRDDAPEPDSRDG